MYCLEMREVVHRFSEKEIVLNKINLQVETSSIYGFLGPNGAGKTTTLRLILGLLRKQQGEISVFGMPFEKNRVHILERIGSLIESPSVYGHLTALENLRVLQRIYQCPRDRMKEVLALVGLSATGEKKAYQFSLGMKQRLSIAMALLHNPSFLILDEPTNGLDPQGIVEVRELLKDLNRERGMTILISSHLLFEIEKLVSHIGIIHKGRMMFEGTLDALSNRQRTSGSVVFETSDEQRTKQIMAQHGVACSTKDGKMIVAPISKDEIAKINHQLVSAGVEVYAITVLKNDLETIFMKLIDS